MTEALAKRSNRSVFADIDFLFEVGTLRHVNRSWNQFGGLPFANVAEHSFRTTLLAMLIAHKEGAKVDRVVQLALIHDLHESRTGDANYVQKMYRNDDVEGACHELGNETSFSEFLHELHAELELCETLESKVVKDADNLDCDFELAEMRDRGANIAEVLRPTRDAVNRTFYTATARDLFAGVQDRSSHHWHLEARNRLTAGDWSKIKS